VTTKRPSQLRLIAVIVLAYLAGGLAYPRLADLSDNGQPSYRGLIAFALPTAILVIHLIFRSLWRHDRVRTGNGAFEATYHAIVFRAMLFVFAMHALLMLALTDVMDVVGTHVWGKRLVVVLLGLAIIAIGNLIPRTRPNIAFGLRTARTLSDTQLWQQVHRAGGYTTVGLGTAILIAGIVITNNAAGGFVLGAAAVAAAIVYVSYRKYANA
jgi:MFS family permease